MQHNWQRENVRTAMIKLKHVDSGLRGVPTKLHAFCVDHSALNSGFSKSFTGLIRTWPPSWYGFTVSSSRPMYDVKWHTHEHTRVQKKVPFFAWIMETKTRCIRFLIYTVVNIRFFALHSVWQNYKNKWNDS